MIQLSNIVVSLIRPTALGSDLWRGMGDSVRDEDTGSREEGVTAIVGGLVLVL